jgi:hypothetical protein
MRWREEYQFRKLVKEKNIAIKRMKIKFYKKKNIKVEIVRKNNQDDLIEKK